MYTHEAISPREHDVPYDGLLLSVAEWPDLLRIKTGLPEDGTQISYFYHPKQMEVGPASANLVEMQIFRTPYKHGEPKQAVIFIVDVDEGTLKMLSCPDVKHLGLDIGVQDTLPNGIYYDSKPFYTNSMPDRLVETGNEWLEWVKEMINLKRYIPPPITAKFVQKISEGI